MKSISTSTLLMGSLLLATSPLWAELRISEICPEPAKTVVATNYMGHGAMAETTEKKTILDPNGRKSGWIELYNDGSAPINLKDYKIYSKKRGKKIKIGSIGTLCDRVVPAKGYTVVYIGEQYENAEDLGGDGVTVGIYDNDVMAVPVSAKPKNFPIVILAKQDDTILEKFYLPVDLPEGCSFAPGTDNSASYVTRAILKTPTKGAANNYVAAIPYGPNAGPLPGKHKFTDLKPNPPATLGTDYVVTMPINPIADTTQNSFKGVKLVYRVMGPNPGYKATGATDFKGMTYKTGEVPMTNDVTDTVQGIMWKGTIPGGVFTENGMLVQWAFEITDNAGKTWRSPSFCDPDNSYQWYGTITEPTSAQSSALPMQTLHLFVDDEMLEPDNEHYCKCAPIDMQHEDYEASRVKQESSSPWKDHTPHPYGARCSIYDPQTQIYYDNVKIDLRGNTTAAFIKKSHGLSFNKCLPWNGTEPFTGESLEDIRKTSFVAEYCDPTSIRQMLSFRVRRLCGEFTPFSYPVKLMMNGKFYQLANHSNRFTDDLLSDYYGFKETDGSIGYGYKNVAQLQMTDLDGPGKGDGGGAEKKTPDDGNDYNLTNAWQLANDINQAIINPDGHWGQASIGPGAEQENPAMTKLVVKSYNQPAWINYLAAARITHEADDIWANLCLYYDSVHTGTWMPLGYDQNLSFGHYFPEGAFSWPRCGTIADKDNHKSHPFYGGWRIKPEGKPKGNNGYEVFYQSPKFRRLHLRRLRTLMDQILKDTGTAQIATPFWQEVVLPMKDAMAPVAEMDDQTWGTGAGKTLDIWGQDAQNNSLMPDFEGGYTDLWDNYIVKRRTHLFKTHAENATTKVIGYNWDLAAGIPAKQSGVDFLKGQFKISVTNENSPTAAIVIANGNDEAVDMSGWKLGGAWAARSWTFLPGEFDQLEGIDEKWMPRCSLPPGTVVDANDVLYVAFDRQAFVQALETSGMLKDQMIIGNVPARAIVGGKITLTANDSFQTLVAQEGDAGKPEVVIPTPSDQNGAKAMDEAAKDPYVKNWLAEIAQQPGGAEAITAFTGIADDILACKYLDKFPVAGAANKLEMKIVKISIDTNGNILIDATMEYDQTPVTTPINGEIVILEYTDLTQTPKVTRLDGITSFPLKGVKPTTTGARFFRIGLQH